MGAMGTFSLEDESTGCVPPLDRIKFVALIKYMSSIKQACLSYLLEMSLTVPGKSIGIECEEW